MVIINEFEWYRDITNENGGAGGAFGGAIFLDNSVLYLSHEQSDHPSFSNNTINLPGSSTTETENIFNFIDSIIMNGFTEYSFQESDGHTDYQCTSSTGFDCACSSGVCQDTN